MSRAAETRRAANDHPFLVDGLRAGVVNFTAAARFLDIDGDIDAVATALRRYAEELPEYEPTTRDARVTMSSGIGPVDSLEDAILTVGATSLGEANGEWTAIVTTGSVDTATLRHTLGALEIADISVHTAGVGEETMAIVVDRLDGANALRCVEGALESATILER